MVFARVASVLESLFGVLGVKDYVMACIIQIILIGALFAFFLLPTVSP